MSVRVLEKLLTLFMSFQQHITSVSYCVGEVADAVHVFRTVHTERQLGCRTSNLSYTLIDAQYALLERHNAVHVFPLVHNECFYGVEEVADDVHVFPTVHIECHVGCRASCWCCSCFSISA